jgi:hypothetical protein
MNIIHSYTYFPNPVDEHEWKINVKGLPYDVWVVKYPLVTEKGYYTIGIINIPGNPRKYGFSNYKNTSKYVLKGMLEDINEYLKNGNFSQFNCHYTPKNI